MPQITNYPVLAAPATDDIVIVVDVSDLTMSPQGTTKQATVGHITSIVGSEAVYSFAAPGGQIVVIVNTDAAPTDASLHLEGKAAGDLTIGGRVTGDADTRWADDTNGTRTWGTGAASPDTSLQRASTGGLTTTSADGNTYDVQRLSLITTTATPVTSTSSTPVTGLSCPVAAKAYRVHAVIVLTMGGTTAPANIGFSGPGITTAVLWCKQFFHSNTAQNVVGTFVATTLGLNATAALASGQAFTVEIDGFIEFSAAGTFRVVAAENTSGDSFTVNSSFLDVLAKN